MYKNVECTTSTNDDLVKHTYVVRLSVAWDGVDPLGKGDYEWEFQLPMEFSSERACREEMFKWLKMTKHYGRHRKVSGTVVRIR